MSNKTYPATELERLYAANAFAYFLTVLGVIVMVVELVARGTWLIVPVMLFALTAVWYALALRWRLYRKNIRDL